MERRTRRGRGRRWETEDAWDDERLAAVRFGDRKAHGRHPALARLILGKHALESNARFAHEEEIRRWRRHCRDGETLSNFKERGGREGREIQREQFSGVVG